MHQAIQTKYLGPTDFKGARVKAFTPYHSVTLSWDSALNERENHKIGAMALARKLEWTGVWSGGGTEDGFCFVQASSDDFVI